jgi:predicted nucleic acid-binding protein
VIIVADSSPLNYLVLIGQVHLLTDLFGEVVVPKAVLAELQSAKTPPAVRDWMQEAPDWLRVEGVPADNVSLISESYLHVGEREAIALAQLLNADYLIIDEKAGRREAVRHNLTVIGTLGVLEKADAEGMVTDFPMVIARLEQTSFYMDRRLKEAVLQRHQARARV